MTVAFLDGTLSAWSCLLHFVLCCVMFVHPKKHAGSRPPPMAPPAPQRYVVMPMYQMLCDHLDFQATEDRSVVFSPEGGPLAVDEAHLMAGVLAIALSSGVALQRPEELGEHFRGYFGYCATALEEFLRGRGLVVVFGTFQEDREGRWRAAILAACEEIGIPVGGDEGGRADRLRLLIRPIADNEMYEPFNTYKMVWNAVQ